MLQPCKAPSTPATMSIVEATGNIVEATFDFVEATFDTVERIVQLVAFDNVAWTLLLVCGASTKLPVASTILL